MPEKRPFSDAMAQKVIDAQVARIKELEDKLIEAEKRLLLIGERAVVDWDDKTVGEVDSAVSEPFKYSDWVKLVMTKATEHDNILVERDNALRQYREVRKTYDTILPELVAAKERISFLEKHVVEIASESLWKSVVENVLAKPLPDPVFQQLK